jgi:hypothetical protein
MGKKINNAGNYSNKERKVIKNETDTQKEEFEQEGNDKLVFVSIKKLQENFECFSKWTKTDMSKFWKFYKNIHNTTWNDIYKTSNKGENKRGFAYNEISIDKYSKKTSFFKTLSEDKTLFELRVDGKIRVHGFREKSVFYLCILDKDHKIC